MALRPDSVAARDQIAASVSRRPVKPLRPCVVCQIGETVEDHPVMDDAGHVLALRRICTRPVCRAVQEG